MVPESFPSEFRRRCCSSLLGLRMFSLLPVDPTNLRYKFLQQRFQIRVRRPTFFISLHSLYLKLHSSLSHFFRIFTNHYFTHCSLYLFPSHHHLPVLPRPFFTPNSNPNPQNISHQPSIQKLLRPKRPCYHWHTCSHTFQRRVPSTVSHEPACCFVIKYQHLWRPSLYHQPFPFHPFLKPFRQPFLIFFLFTIPFHYPNESLP